MKAKRFVLSIVILVLIVAVLWLLNDKFKVVSLGGPKTPDYNYTIGEFKKEDLGIFDIKTGKTIYLGMKQEEVEKILGNGEEISGMIKIHEYPGKLQIKYRLDQVCAIRIGDDTDGDRYLTPRNISKQNNQGEVKLVYGDPSSENSEIVDYFINKDNETYRLIDSLPSDRDKRTTTFIIDFTYGEGRKLNIYIMDYLFAQTFQ